jgi:dipeptidyl aminopeptidase/acylaminoacyl peptidase
VARKRRIEIEDLFRLRTVTAADVSPDGERIAFAVQRQDLAKNKTFSSLYLIPARGGRLRRLTRGDHADGAPRFSPDGRVLAFLSDRDKGRSVWLLPMEGGEPERLTDRDGTVSDYDWSPDGKTIAISYRPLTERQKLERDGKTDAVARRPDFRHVTRLRYKMDGAGYLPEKERFHVHIVRVASGKRTPITKGEHDDLEPRFSPDGSRIAFVSNRVEDPDLFPGNGDLYTVRRDGAGLRKVTREPGAAGSAVWTPDGKQLVYLGNVSRPFQWARHHIHVRRVPAGGGASVDLTPDLDRNAYNAVIGDLGTALASGPGPVVAPDGESVVFCFTDEGACRLATVPLGGGETVVRDVGSPVVLGYGFAREAATGWLLAGDLLEPGDLYRLPDGDGSPKRLTRLNATVLRGLDLVEPEEVRIPRPGGEVHGWLLRPPGFRKGRRYPAVLEVHGGPHVAYGRVFFHEMQLLAARGYIVLMTNPRGSDGYGLDHRTAILNAYGTVDADDLMTAVDALLKREPVDPKRLYLTGGSYGGFMTNWLVAHTDRFRAAVTQRSVTNLSSFFGSSDIGWSFGQAEFDGTPWDEPERYERCSPLTYADRVETPLLILHSESDLRCPIEQGEQLFVKLKVLGKEVEMVRFVGESHGLSRGGRPQNRAERLRRILDWFKRHGGR